MATISVLNTSANLSGKTLLSAENDYTITGNHTFSRSPSAPFTVTAASSVVTNLDADKLDGLDSTVFARWDGLGTSLGQIAFPAAQSASTGANVLDDYEEGTWTPTITGSGGGSGQVYGTQLGNYVKFGQMVIAGFDITLTTLGTITTSAIIGGLPFTALSTGTRWSGSIIWSSTTSSFVSMNWQINTGGTTAALLGATAAATSNATAVVQGDLSNTTTIRGILVYRASA